MANPYDAVLIQESGIETFAGQVNFTDPDNQPAGPFEVQSITGSLSTVADAPAKAVLTSIIDGLVALGLATDDTT